MRWRRELDGGRERELEAGGRTRLKGGDRKTCMEKMVDISVWLVRICERYGGRPDKRGQEAPESEAWEQEKGAGRLTRGVVCRKAVLEWALRAGVEGRWMGYITGWYSWRGRNVGK